MNWTLLPQFFATGLLQGGVYALVALGLVLVYKSSGVFNFAQGHLLTMGAFVSWWLIVEAGLPIWAGLLLALGAAVILGILIERLALRPLIGQPILSAIMVTLALAQLMQGLVILIWGPEQRAYPQLFPLEPFRLPEITVGEQVIRVVLKQNLVWSFVVAIAGVAAFALFFRLTDAGLAMRAAAEDHSLAQSTGLRVRRIFAVAWAIAAVVATGGGVLLATVTGIDPGLSVVGLKAFPAVLFGGLESIPGAIVGGLTVGVIESLVQGLPGDASIRALGLGQIAPYAVMLLVLLFRPQGLFGLKRIERI